MLSGTMLVSENGRQLYLHSLAHSPKARLQRIMKQPSPEMGRRGMLDHSEEAGTILVPARCPKQHRHVLLQRLATTCRVLTTQMSCSLGP